jgi:hypothetical protein
VAAAYSGFVPVLYSFLKNRCRFSIFKNGNARNLSNAKNSLMNFNPRIKISCYILEKK